LITMPISDYPASSDETAQMQVLSERKGEITQQIQDVQDSGLDEGSKAAKTDSLREETSNLNVQIRHKQVEKDYKENLVDEQNESQRTENNALEEQAADSSDSEVLLDTRA
jgi:hypothetical protein